MFSLMPSLVDPNAQSSRLDPAARLTIGKTIALLVKLGPCPLGSRLNRRPVLRRVAVTHGGRP